MGNISIKVNIAGRIYPLSIDSEEEEVIRMVTKEIDERLKTYQENYQISEKQDLLSMCVLHYATLAKKGDAKFSANKIVVDDQLLQISAMLDDCVSEQ